MAYLACLSNNLLESLLSSGFRYITVVFNVDSDSNNYANNCFACFVQNNIYTPRHDPTNICCKQFRTFFLLLTRNINGKEFDLTSGISSTHSQPQQF